MAALHQRAVSESGPRFLDARVLARPILYCYWVGSSDFNFLDIPFLCCPNLFWENWDVIVPSAVNSLDLAGTRLS